MTRKLLEGVNIRKSLKRCKIKEVRKSNERSMCLFWSHMDKQKSCSRRRSSSFNRLYIQVTRIGARTLLA